MYVPSPINTANVELPSSLTTLVEYLAKNAHEQWAQQRIADGWTYGPARDDAQKRHPCLVPYDELPEDEKVYDRLAVTETLKAINIFGYHIVDDIEF